jgi:hypothetical protein
MPYRATPLMTGLRKWFLCLMAIPAPLFASETISYPPGKSINLDTAIGAVCCVPTLFNRGCETVPVPKSKYDQTSTVSQFMDINQLLESYLRQYSQQYQEYNANPQAWEAKFGSWTEFEHREKAKLLQEMGQILQLLAKITHHEQKLDTLGDLEYYSTAIQYLNHLRQFLEARTRNL